MFGIFASLRQRLDAILAQEYGETNKRFNSKIIFGGQMERSSNLLCVAPQRQLKDVGIYFVIFFSVVFRYWYKLHLVFTYWRLKTQKLY